MIIYHPNLKKEVNVEDLEIVHHIVSEKGVEVRRKCIEFQIIGENSQWKDWLYYEEFEKYNRGVGVE